jgi:hypothetical protein
MCVYCHEFIKRNRPVCGYCHTVFPKVKVAEEETVRPLVPISFRHVVALVLATIALGLVVGGAIDVFLLRPPALLETVEISEPANVELVELIPYTPWIH